MYRQLNVSKERRSKVRRKRRIRRKGKEERTSKGRRKGRRRSKGGEAEKEEYKQKKQEAKKQETIDYVKDKYGIEILKDDESDAIAIGTAYLLEREE